MQILFKPDRDNEAGGFGSDVVVGVVSSDETQINYIPKLKVFPLHVHQLDKFLKGEEYIYDQTHIKA